MKKIIEHTNELIGSLLGHDAAKESGMSSLGSYARCSACRAYARRLDQAANDLL